MPVEPELEQWLKTELERYGFSDITIAQGKVKWTIKADGARLGTLTRQEVADRDLPSIQRMLRLPVVVRVQLVRPGVEEYDDLEALVAARKKLYDELFTTGRLSAQYLTSLAQDARYEDHCRKSGFSEDTKALATWAYRRISGYEEERLAKKRICLTGAVKSVLGQTVMTAYSKWRKSNYTDRLADFTSETIRLRSDSWKLERTTKPVRWVVHFAVSSKLVRAKHEKNEKSEVQWHSVVVSTNKNPSVHATLRKMLSGEIKTCDAKLRWERQNRCWVFQLCGMKARPERSRGDNVMAVRRGLTHPIYRLISTGRSFDIDGHSYIHQKRGLAARKKRIQETQWERGAGNRSHGRTKRLQTRRALSEAERNLTKTTIRQWWSDTIKIARRHRVSVIVIEDFSSPIDRSFLETVPDDLAWLLKRFPWGEVKSWGQSACAKSGIRLVEVSAASRSHVCPCCGDETPNNYQQKVQQLLCSACGARMPAVFAEGWNMLKRSELLTDDAALKSVQRGWQSQIEALGR